MYVPVRKVLLTAAVLVVPLSSAVAGTASAAPADSEVLASAVAFDGGQGGPQVGSKTVTLPLYTGIGPKGLPVRYIVTESSASADATARGVNFAPKLANALGTAAVQHTTVDRLGTVHFSGTVDFGPTRSVTPGAAPNFFPPTAATPGAVGDALYSPLTSSGDGVVVNMPQITNASGRNDSVVSVDDLHRTVTLSLFGGFYDDHPILYVRTEASDPVLAAVESSTYAPNLAAAPGLGSDDPTSSAREAIVPIVNGPTGVTNPQRQGLDSAVAGEGAPLNIIQEEPGGASSQFYSPVWDVTPGVWTDPAIAAGARTRLRSDTAVEQQARIGNLTGSGTGPRNPKIDLNAAGFVSLCPVIAVLPVP